MLRKTLTLGMVFILVVSLLVVSLTTCFTYEADAHLVGCKWVCWWIGPFCIPILIGECQPHFHTG